MSPDASSSTPRPVFKHCVRCKYSLRGLPANHACPECGLRFDENCALYRVTNPRAVIAIWACVFGSGFGALHHLPDLPNFGALSVWDKIGVGTALLWFPMVGFGIWFLIRLYRRGQEVAVMTDGLIIRLATFDDELIPWERIGPASVQDIKAGKAQIARVFLLDKNKQVVIGGMSNVFPTRMDVEQFVKQINERARGGDAEPASNDENIPS